MSAPEPRESIWLRILQSQDDRSVWIRFVLLAGLMAAGAYGVMKVIDAFAVSGRELGAKPASGAIAAANANGGLIIDASELDFGEVWEQPWLDVLITVQNPTMRDVQVDGWSGGDRFEIVPDQVTVPAQGLVALRVHFDPVFGPHTSDVFDVVEIERPFRPQIAGEPGTHPGWTLSGRVKRAVSVSTHLLEFSRERLRRGDVFPTKSVDVMALRPIKALKAQFDPEELAIGISGPDIRNWYKVSVTPAASVSVGDHTFPVGLQMELQDGTLVETDFDVHVNEE